MAVLVRIPTPLRALTKGAAEVQADAGTVTDLIAGVLGSVVLHAQAGGGFDVPTGARVDAAGHRRPGGRCSCRGDQHCPCPRPGPAWPAAGPGIWWSVTLHGRFCC